MFTLPHPISPDLASSMASFRSFDNSSDKAPNKGTQGAQSVAEPRRRSTDTATSSSEETMNLGWSPPQDKMHLINRVSGLYKLGTLI